jgi:hypothetical protein
MKEASKMLRQMTLEDSRNAISSQESVAGHKPSSLQDGLKIDQSGQEVAPANLSARQAKEKGLLTNVTSGPLSTGSSNSVSLTLFLESKLRAKLESIGSTLYRLTWKRKTMQSGRWYFQRVASELRTEDKEFGSWPTPTVDDSSNSTRQSGTFQSLTRVARSSWGTPTVAEPGGTPEQFLERKRRHNSKGLSQIGLNVTALSLQAQLTSWATPKVSMGDYQKDKNGNKILNLSGQAKLSGQIVNGSTVEMENIGQLNPEHCRWLMGYPAEWGYCGATAMQSRRKSRKK